MCVQTSDEISFRLPKRGTALEALRKKFERDPSSGKESESMYSAIIPSPRRPIRGIFCLNRLKFELKDSAPASDKALETTSSHTRMKPSVI